VELEARDGVGLAGEAEEGARDARGDPRGERDAGDDAREEDEAGEAVVALDGAEDLLLGEEHADDPAEPGRRPRNGAVAADPGRPLLLEPDGRGGGDRGALARQGGGEGADAGVGEVVEGDR